MQLADLFAHEPGIDTDDELAIKLFALAHARWQFVPRFTRQGLTYDRTDIAVAFRRACADGAITEETLVLAAAEVRFGSMARSAAMRSMLMDAAAADDPDAAMTAAGELFCRR
jgi:hypothetical protein